MRTALLLLMIWCASAGAQPTLDGPMAAAFARQHHGPSGCALTNGLAGYWAFNGDYTDSSGLGQTLTPQSSPYFASGYIYQAMGDDTGGYATLADNSTIGLGGDVSFAISCWVYQGGSSALKSIIQKGTAFDFVHSTYIIYNDGTRFVFAIGDGAGGHSAAVGATNTGTPVAFTEYNIIANYDAGAHQISITVNGVTNVPVAWTFGTVRNSAALAIGANSAGSFVYNGAIDEVVMWTNRSLSWADISSVYTDTTRGLTPLTYCSGRNGRNTVFFSGDARFGTSGSSNSIPQYFHGAAGTAIYPVVFAGSPWASNHNATIVLHGGSVNPPPSPPNVQQIDDWTNAALHQASDNSTNWIADIGNYYGPGTNLYYIPQNGINDIFIMTNGPLYGYWTHSTIATVFTNWLNYVHARLPNIKIVSTTIIPQIGLDLDAGDGSGMTQEQVRQFVNQAITNQFPLLFGGLNADLFSPTNNSPPYWFPNNNQSEYNDTGATNFAVHLNTLMNSLAP